MGDTTCEVLSFISLITKACLAFYSFKYGYKVIFTGIRGVLLNSFVSVLKSINSLLDNNAKQLELTRSKIASILSPSNYQQCQEFIDKIKEKRVHQS